MKANEITIAVIIFISGLYIAYKFGDKYAAEKEFARINSILQCNYGIILNDRALNRIGIIEDKLNIKKGGSYADIR